MSNRAEPWDGVNRRAEPRNQDIIEMIASLARETKHWRKDMDVRVESVHKSMEEFRRLHEPTLISIAKKADYWGSVKDEVLRKLITSGMIAAGIAVLIGIWQTIKDHLK